MKKLLLCAFALTVVSCAECKKPGTLRCKGNIVQVCGGDKRWKKSRNCDKFANTKCGKFKDVTTCVLQKKKVK